MIAIAVVNNKADAVLDFRQLLEMIERDYQLDAQDIAGLIEDAAENYTQYPEMASVFENVNEIMGRNTRESQDGVWGDQFYTACEEIQNAQEEIRAEIENLRSTSRKGNTKEDIAKRLENIVSNMNDIL